MTTISAVHQVLGDAFDMLPLEVRNAHDHDGLLILQGTSDVISGGWLGRLICALTGLPRPGLGQPVTVSLETGSDGIDRWRRDFNGRRYRSSLAAGTGPHVGRLVEQQGPMTNVFALEAQTDRLIFCLKAFAIFGIFLPRWLAPRCDAFESSEAGAFKFDIVIDAPVIGRLISYRGKISASDY